VTWARPPPAQGAAGQAPGWVPAGPGPAPPIGPARVRDPRGWWRLPFGGRCPFLGGSLWGQGPPPLPHGLAHFFKPLGESPQPPYLHFLSPLSTDKKCNGWEHFIWLEFSPTPSVLPKHVPPPPFLLQNVILKSNFQTKIAYDASKQHVFILRGKNGFGTIEEKILHDSIRQSNFCKFQSVHFHFNMPF
jgi:hypothetical protein